METSDLSTGGSALKAAKMGRIVDRELERNRSKTREIEQKNPI